MVIIEYNVNSIIPKGQIRPYIQFIRRFPLQISIPQRLQVHTKTRCIPTIIRCISCCCRISRKINFTCLTIRRSQFQLVNNSTIVQKIIIMDIDTQSSRPKRCPLLVSPKLGRTIKTYRKIS